MCGIQGLENFKHFWNKNIYVKISYRFKRPGQMHHAANQKGSEKGTDKVREKVGYRVTLHLKHKFCA